MVLVVSIALALGAAVGYGAGTAVEHAAASSGTGGWRDPRWRLGIALDGAAALLQAAALATGPVILVQPCLVLALPVSLLVAWRLGASRPTAVLLGALLLHEDIPHTPRDFAVFTICLLAVGAGVTRVSSGVTSMHRGMP